MKKGEESPINRGNQSLVNIFLTKNAKVNV